MSQLQSASRVGFSTLSGFPSNQHLVRFRSRATNSIMVTVRVKRRCADLCPRQRGASIAFAI
jgi:hypothetical protein